MPRYLAFQVADVLPDDDPLSEWIVTLALAMNDLSLVHDRLDVDQDEPDRAFYWHRLALSHFSEAALFLNDTAEVPEVAAFVESLSDEAREKYDECLAVFRERRGELFNTRNKATFHYPTLRPSDPRVERPVRDALAELRNDRGVVRLGRIREARALFADDVVATIFATAVGGLAAAEEFYTTLAKGTTAFISFANFALDEHVARARERGAAIDEVEPVDENDLRAGWRVKEADDDGRAE